MKSKAAPLDIPCTPLCEGSSMDIQRIEQIAEEQMAARQEWKERELFSKMITKNLSEHI